MTTFTIVGTVDPECDHDLRGKSLRPFTIEASTPLEAIQRAIGGKPDGTPGMWMLQGANVMAYRVHGERGTTGVDYRLEDTGTSLILTGDEGTFEQVYGEKAA